MAAQYQNNSMKDDFKEPEPIFEIEDPQLSVEYNIPS